MTKTSPALGQGRRSRRFHFSFSGVLFHSFVLCLRSALIVPLSGFFFLSIFFIGLQEVLQYRRTKNQTSQLNASTSGVWHVFIILMINPLWMATVTNYFPNGHTGVIQWCRFPMQISPPDIIQGLRNVRICPRLKVTGQRKRSQVIKMNKGCWTSRFHETCWNKQCGLLIPYTTGNM